MDNGSFDMSEGQVSDMLKRASRTGMDLLKELYQKCKDTRVVYGQGDIGDVLAYSRDLEDRVTDAILDNCEPGDQFNEFAISISHGVAVHVERTKEGTKQFIAWLEGTYTYHGKPTTSIQILHMDHKFEPVLKVARAYQNRRGYKIFLQGDLAKNAIIERKP